MAKFTCDGCGATAEKASMRYGAAAVLSGPPVGPTPGEWLAVPDFQTTGTSWIVMHKCSALALGGVTVDGQIDPVADLDPTTPSGLADAPLDVVDVSGPLGGASPPAGPFPTRFPGAVASVPLPPQIAAGYAEDLLNGVSDPMAVMKALMGPLVQSIGGLRAKNEAEVESAAAIAADAWLGAAERAKKLGLKKLYEDAVKKAERALAGKKRKGAKAQVPR